MNNLQKRKKILFLIATLFQGGGERVISELSLHFPEHIQSTVILYENKVSYPFKGKILSLDIPISTNFFLRPYYFLLRFIKLKKLIKKECPDHVVSFGYGSNMMNIFVNRNVILRTDLFLSKSATGFFGWVYKLFVKFFFKKASSIVVVSYAIKKDLICSFGVPEEKIRVIYNPVDIEKIQKLSRQPLEDKYQRIFQNPVVITSGRLTRQKSQWHLLRAFKIVKDAIPAVQLVILGDGELRLNLQELANKLDLQDDVHFLGWQKNPFSFLARSELFVLSSLWEGLPGVLPEAMVCGLPIVSTDCKSGPREILAPSTDYNFQTKDIEHAECGILVPVCDGKLSSSMNLTREEKMLSEAIIELCLDKTLSFNLAQKAKKRVEDFRLEKIIKEWDFIL